MANKRVQPVAINLHKQSRILAIEYEDGACFELPCEYLRVFSPSAEVMGHGPGQAVLQTGKEAVNIDRIEPVGHYAVKLIFDDGHNTGLYTFDYLYELGETQEDNWQDYLTALKQAGHARKGGAKGND